LLRSRLRGNIAIRGFKTASDSHCLAKALRVHTRIKICGITRFEDALAACDAGADAIGLVFHPASPRAISAEAARTLVMGLPPLITVVGLFLDAQADVVRSVLERVPLGLLQFHGNESADYCERFPLRYIKAVAMGGEADPIAYAASHPAAAGFLLDSHGAGEQGGSGKAFDWDRIPKHFGRPLILAGGLGPGNVAEAVSQYHPYGVDVSSGLESAPGVKDVQRIKAFMREVQGAR